MRDVCAMATEFDRHMDACMEKARALGNGERLVKLGELAVEFARGYDALSPADARVVNDMHPGRPGTTYARGWVGLWDRRRDGDDELRGADELCGRMMRAAKLLHPVLRRLRDTGRAAAVPNIAPMRCRPLLTCAAAIGDDHESGMCEALCKALEEAASECGRPVSGSAKDVEALARCIDDACRTDGVPVPERPTARKRSAKGTLASRVRAIREKLGADGMSDLVSWVEENADRLTGRRASDALSLNQEVSDPQR